MAAAERLSADLARAGLTIVSGMARGIDTSAHQAALKENADTIAVLGCGVDVVYPSNNRRLYDEIAKKGPAAFRIPDRRARLPAKLSHSQPHREWTLYWRAHCRRRSA